MEEIIIKPGDKVEDIHTGGIYTVMSVSNNAIQVEPPNGYTALYMHKNSVGKIIKKKN